MTDHGFHPDWFSRPGDTLAHLMVRRGLSVSALSQILRCEKDALRRVILGAKQIDRSLAERLSAATGPSASFWMRRQASYDDALSRSAAGIAPDQSREWIKTLPIREMSELGWLQEPPPSSEAVKACMAYFDVSTIEEWRRRYVPQLGSIAFRTSPTFSSTKGSLAAWLRRGEIEASLVGAADWNPDVLRERLDDLRRLTLAKSPRYFLPRMQEICASAGVAVVFVRAPKGCRASGAARFVAPRKAVIILSFRHKSDDHFWFTFFHEIAHLLLHEKATTFVDDICDDSNDIEAEANLFAARLLIPSDRLEQLHDLAPKRDCVMRFAVSIGTAAGIVVGQLQHLGVIERSQLNFLKRRYDWDEILSAIP